MDDFKANKDNLEDDAEKRENFNLKTDDQEENPIDWSTLDQLRELQRAKKRSTKGIDVMSLLTDNKNDKTSEDKGDKTGGLTDAKTLANELDLGNTFSIETNRRDEDAELMRYVEEELSKRRCNDKNYSANSNEGKNNISNLANDLLIKSIPKHLLKVIDESNSKNEEMLSSQMLSGIPEVDLGIEEKIKNIEVTEAARMQLLEKRTQEQKKHSNDEKDGLSFVPKNLASCFTNRTMPNHRFNLTSVSIENKELNAHFNQNEKKLYANIDGRKIPLEQTYEVEPVVVIGDEPQKIRMPKILDKDKRLPGKDKPTDNYVFQKFKNQLKKH